METHSISTIALILAGAVPFGALVVFRGWQMHFRHRHDLIRDWEGDPIPAPERHSARFFGLYAGCGLTIALVPTLLLLLTPLHVIGVLTASSLPLAALQFGIGRIARSARAKA